MMKQLLFFSLSLVVLLCLVAGNAFVVVGQETQDFTVTPLPSAANHPLSLPNDIISPTVPIAVARAATATDYKVTPVLFVPSDITPNPLALQFIDKQMQLVQRWYGQQLRNRTFTLEAARLVKGTHPIAFYYGSCYPPNTSCDWGQILWGNIFNDLSGLGYPSQDNRVTGVFFQHDGIGGTALGGGVHQFLVGIEPNNIFGDCLAPGCALRVSEGAAAHELGHALGLPHTLDDPEGSPGLSIMNYGFYQFPRATFVNTAINPERNVLYASPFLNLTLTLNDGGFEDCLTQWTSGAGSPTCTTTAQRSGLAALELTPNNGQPDKLSQDVAAQAGQTYDFSGWLKLGTSTSNVSVQVRLLALSSSNTVLAAFVAGNYSAATVGWTRFALSALMPAKTVKVRVQIDATGLGATVDIDDLDFQQAQRIPPAPLPMFYNDDDAVPTLQPTLQWSEIVLATAYQIQVATDKNFTAPLLDAATTGLAYPITSGLAYDTHYFWRVRATNGAGQSAWSTPWRFVPRAQANYFSDEFEVNTLNGAWSWTRPDPTHWFFGGPLNRRSQGGYLGITTQAGDLAGNTNNAKNLLLKQPPAGPFEISALVDFWEPLSTNYQQGGLVIYQDDDNYLKLVSMYSDHFQIARQGEINGVAVGQTATPVQSALPLKIAYDGAAYQTYYSTDGASWRALGQPLTVHWAAPRIGLLAYSQVDAKPATAFFDWFRVSAALPAAPTPTATATATPTPTATGIATATPTATGTAAATPSATPSTTETATATQTATATPVATATETLTPTATATATIIEAPSATERATPTPSAISTPTPSATVTPNIPTETTTPVGNSAPNQLYLPMILLGK